MKSYVVGLTGQSGAGKTTVCKVFELNGFHIINADMVSRYVTTENKSCISELRSAFPEYFENSVLNRRKLGSLVFADRNELDRLTSITFPYIIDEINRCIDKIGEGEFILIDAPTLFESGLNDSCDIIVSVIAGKDLRLRRIIKRDNIPETEAKKRFSSQLSEKFFKENSDYIIENNSGVEQLKDKAIKIAMKIKEIYYAKNGT